MRRPKREEEEKRKKRKISKQVISLPSIYKKLIVK